MASQGSAAHCKKGWFCVVAPHAVHVPSLHTLTGSHYRVLQKRGEGYLWSVSGVFFIGPSLEARGVVLYTYIPSTYLDTGALRQYLRIAEHMGTGSCGDRIRQDPIRVGVARVARLPRIALHRHKPLERATRLQKGQTGNVETSRRKQTSNILAALRQ